MEIKKVDHRPDRETVDVSFCQTFGIDLGVKQTHGKPLIRSGSPVMKDVLVKAFTKPGILTPKVDLFHKFPKEETVMCVMALSQRDTTYLVGHSGTGKTNLVRQIAARLNYNVVQLSFDGHLSRSDLIGEWKIRNNNGIPEMAFRYGLVPLGFVEPGTILLFDEVDACPPDTAFVLQRAISSDLQFLMHETNELFELHPQSCIMATANTTGQGDESGLYIAGTNIQNFSFLNRWKTTIHVDYLSAKEEEEVLTQMFTETATPKLTENIRACCAVAAAAREGFKGGSLSVPLTIRDTINWVDKLRRMPYPMRTARYSFLNRMSTQDAFTLAQIIQRYFALSIYDDHKFIKQVTDVSF